jgi:hypothetical protein
MAPLAGILFGKSPFFGASCWQFSDFSAVLTVTPA